MVDTVLARGIPIAFSFGSEDPVARPEDAAEHFDGIADDNFKMYVYPGDHTLCDSPYVMTDLIQHSIR